MSQRVLRAGGSTLALAALGLVLPLLDGDEAWAVGNGGSGPKTGRGDGGNGPKTGRGDGSGDQRGAVVGVGSRLGVSVKRLAMWLLKFLAGAAFAAVAAGQLLEVLPVVVGNDEWWAARQGWTLLPPRIVFAASAAGLLLLLLLLASQQVRDLDSQVADVTM